MASADATLLLLHPALTSKAQLIARVRELAGPNCPNIADLLISIAHTDFNALTDKSSLNAVSDFGL